MKPDEYGKLVEASELAYRWHSGQRRKATDIPYISHPLQVEGLILEHGGNCDQALAGLLHDSLEDAPDSEERARREEIIQERFGRVVLSMILSCTDTLPGESLEDKGDWNQRKDRYIDQLSRASAETHLVAACDKLHNLHAMVSDSRTLGPEIFERFTARPSQTLWYYTTVIDLLRPSLPDRLIRELDELLAALRVEVASITE
ncbi:MAG: HD domain-containing protein [Myxococcota bacterium]|nr:HD domain-containing protein [Myxococcota bacterium]